MTDHLTQLVNLSHNFSFLAEPALHLACDGAAAEVYVRTDPDAALTKARRFGETLVKMLLPRAAIPFDRRSSHDSRIKALAEAGVIPVRIRQLLDIGRRSGNRAAHEHPSDQQQSMREAMSAVKACFELGIWWYRTETRLAWRARGKRGSGLDRRPRTPMTGWVGWR